jgi:regulator of cell morphogenesis and NO signaling
MQRTITITADHTLAELAATRAGAARVFYRHGLDFCCHGRVSLSEVCTKKQLDLDALVREIEAEAPLAPSFERWDARPLAEVVSHVITDFHEPHRAELTRLLAMARKVEQVHADNPERPRGLADHVESMQLELGQHMQKEELVLFPLIVAGRGRAAAIPIQVLEEEHDDHAKSLARLRVLTDDFHAPEGACVTWKALYLGLAELEQLLMEHIHLENNVLFPRALMS